MEKIVAVVVTYNRLELLKKTIAALKRQSVPVSDIVVINNSSTDGTDRWLAENDGLKIVTQANVGGAGGFHRGILEAMKLSPDRIWVMDDDVFPRKDCLECLLSKTPSIGIAVPAREIDGHRFATEFRKFDFKRPFASTHQGKIAKDLPEQPIQIAGATFEGILIGSDVIRSIGLPNKDLFIFFDDTEYCLRAGIAGFPITYVPDAVMEKYHFFADSTWTERQIKKKWKRRYQIRNSTWLNHKYGQNFFVRYLRGFNTTLGYMLTAIITAPFSKAYSMKDTAMMWHAYTDGLKGKLGK